MNKEKQIEEMARAMCFQRDSCTVKSCTKVNCEKTWLAENLYNAGYRKASEVALEVISKIEQNFEIGYGEVLEFRKFLAELKKKYIQSEDKE